MNIAITGSSGFIGTALSKRLTINGHNIIPIARRPLDTPHILWDPQNNYIDQESLSDAKLDIVIHLAGEGIANKRWSQKQKDLIANSRIEGTRILVSALSEIENKPKHLISASAIGYYGIKNVEHNTETSPPGDDYLSRLCIDWEAEAQKITEHKIKLSIIRVGHVLHRSGGLLKQLVLPFKLGLGGKIGNGQQYMSCISLQDIIRAITFIAQHTHVGIFNLSGPEPVTNIEFTKQFGKALKRPTIIPTPLWPLKLYYTNELVQAVLLASQRATPNALLDKGFEFNHPTLEEMFKYSLEEKI